MIYTSVLLGVELVDLKIRFPIKIQYDFPIFLHFPILIVLQGYLYK